MIHASATHQREHRPACFYLSSGCLCSSRRMDQWERRERDVVNLGAFPREASRGDRRGCVFVLCYVSVHGIGRAMQVTKQQSSKATHSSSTRRCRAGIGIGIGHGRRQAKERDGVSSLAVPFPSPFFFHRCSVGQSRIHSPCKDKASERDGLDGSMLKHRCYPLTSQIMHAYVHGMRRIALAPHRSRAASARYQRDEKDKTTLPSTPVRSSSNWGSVVFLSVPTALWYGVSVLLVCRSHPHPH
ncbi:MAG: hypothetical protein BYD32DRAFT_428637 [Podila humilis]|nr:MAG: hypothetical protein BYD32DRAFT_428637 [Podila humilis]